MKPGHTILQTLGSINPLLFLIWVSLIVKIRQKIYKMPLNFAPCGPPYDPADRRVARGRFELESPVVEASMQSVIWNLSSMDAENENDNNDQEAEKRQW